MNKTFAIVAAATAGLLVLLFRKRPKRDKLHADLLTLPVVRVAQLRDELAIRHDDTDVNLICPRPAAPQTRPHGCKPTLSLILELKLCAGFLRDKTAHIRAKHKVDVSRLRMSFDQLLAEVTKEGCHHQRCHAEATRRFERNQECLRLLRIARLVAHHGDAEAEFGMSELRKGHVSNRPAFLAPGC